MNRAALRKVARLDLALERFLNHHRRRPRRVDGARVPWTLILNGDIIDFLHIGLEPEGGLRADEARYGLAFTQHRSRWKLQQIARYHRRAFRAFARFIDAGNRIVFVAGNHDVDLWFPKIRRDLSHHIAAHSRRPKAARRHVLFAPWFYHEPGRVYSEHGHRFDPYSTFTDPLDPLAPLSELPQRQHRERQIHPSFAHWGLRYFANENPSLPIQDIETWGVRDFISWGFSEAGRGLPRLFYSYLRFLWRYLRDVADAQLHATGPQGRRRRRRIARFARRARLSFERALELDRLQRPHIGSSLLRFAHATYLDRFLFVALLPLLALLLDFLLPARWSPLFYWLSLGGCVAGGWIFMSLRRPPQDVHPFLAKVAHEIQDITGVPVVIFGHTHQPTLERHEGVFWLNPGSWEHYPMQHAHRPDAPCDCEARFALIEGEGTAMQIELSRWCGVTGQVEVIRQRSVEELEEEVRPARPLSEAISARISALLSRARSRSPAAVVPAESTMQPTPDAAPHAATLRPGALSPSPAQNPEHSTEHSPEHAAQHPVGLQAAEAAEHKVDRENPSDDGAEA